MATRSKMGRRKARRSGPSPATLTEDAYRLIKWRITTVQLTPGTTFTEPGLARELELSRTPLREALLLLRHEGLVTVEGRMGYRVSPITLRDVHDLAAVRRALEGDAAAWAAHRLAEAGELSSLEDRVPANGRRGASVNFPKWIDDDRRFHLALAVAAGNQHLVSALDPVLEKSARLLYLLLVLDPSTTAVAHDHADLMAALRAHDDVRARQVALDGITATEEAAAHALRASPGLLSASFVVETPRNQFYLDVTPAEMMTRAKPATNKVVRRQTAEPLGVKR